MAPHHRHHQCRHCSIHNQHITSCINILLIHINIFINNHRDYHYHLSYYRLHLHLPPHPLLLPLLQQLRRSIFSAYKRRRIRT
ncbi:hypothetical protein HanHA300_Chr09g0325991 [Helianthus annuus]|nr:hypothetical protein HanHA300_Chr09g0325991 [Helianthus annuus]KAJ0543085.1 hypothetical protein HanHA89_Chr09g0346911 [Helianthus annuus]KAJ0708138.1 hypothetical protein HanLR1_Chr09g0326231 [Helianthus annuus]KAJ0712097.1 hypothetical protein HanOQP8_Chr09g0331151 [Helianthus annuus]